MPAPDYATLFNVEDSVEDACKAIFLAAGYTRCYAQRETRNLPDSRVDVQLHISTTRDGRDDAWNGVLEFACWRDRSDDNAASVGHLRGLVRDLFCRYRANNPAASDPAEKYGWHPAFTEDVLPYHVVNQLRHTDAVPQVEVKDDCDICVVTFEAVISVRPGAHPVPAQNNPLTTEAGDQLITEAGDELVTES